MLLKINTKEKFYSIIIEDKVLDAIMTANLSDLCKKKMSSSPHNIILNLENIVSVDNSFAKKLFELQNYFYDHNHSFVICCIKKSIRDLLNISNYLDVLNHTPTESEAWDIIQMEEIERDFLKEED